jgi:hypothetical protein
MIPPVTLLPDRSTLLLPFRKGPSSLAQPLRVGVVLDSSHPSPWMDELVSFLNQLPGIDVRVLTLIGQAAAPAKRPPWLTGRLYSASRARFDPFGDIASNTASNEAKADFEFVDAIRTANCEVLVWLAAWRGSNLDLGGLAKHGAFTVRLGERNQPIPFWEEVAKNEVTSTMTIYWHESSFARGRAVRKVETSTCQGLFFTLNAEQPLSAAIRSLADLCLQIQRGGGRRLEGLRGFADEPMTEGTAEDYPTNFESGQFIVQKLARSAQLRWKNRGATLEWFVAMRPATGAPITGPGRLDLKGFREVPLPRGVEAMADPFVWEAGGRNYLFFEELAIGSSRGRLGCVEVFEDGSCSEMKIILHRDYHLSYPCVVAADGGLFLLPETSESGRVDLYRFTRFPWEVELCAPLVEGVALVDTTPVFLNDRWYFFTTPLQSYMETLLFWSDRLDGAWNLHPCSPISCSVRNGRSAGNLFWRDGRLYRPTQDWSVSAHYAHAIQMNEVIRLTPSEFEERAASWIPPTWAPGLLGTHTWNESSRLQVLDGIRANRGRAKAPNRNEG